MSFLLNVAEYLQEHGFRRTCHYSALRLRAKWSTKAKRQLERIHLRTMVSGKELATLYKLASETTKGLGQMVDLGCWLGGTTVPMAQGLMDNPHPAAQDKQVHAYDLFEFNEWMAKTYRETPLAKYQVGDSFLDSFEENVRPWASRICVHPGNICQETWDHGPIEILHIDAMKSWQLTNHILQQFFSALIPGKSIIAHQDYVQFHAVWIHLVMYRLREYFEPVLEESNSNTVVFRYVKKIPRELLFANYKFGDFSPEEMETALDYSLTLAPARIKGNLIAARVMLYVHLGDLDRADQEYRKAVEWEKEYLAKTPGAQPSEINQLTWQIEEARRKQGSL